MIIRVPLMQNARIARYILSQKLKGNKGYPLVLMLEPLFSAPFGLLRLREDRLFEAISCASFGVTGRERQE